MKEREYSGFTLIELIIVISVIGIMSAVAVPKFFDIVQEAHRANKLAIIGVVRTALNNWAAQKLATTGSKYFPTKIDITHLSVLLDEVPENWTFSNGILSYAGDGTQWAYSHGGSTYKLTIIP